MQIIRINILNYYIIYIYIEWILFYSYETVQLFNHLKWSAVYMASKCQVFRIQTPLIGLSARLHVGMEIWQPETSESSNKSSCRVREGHSWKGGIRLALCHHQMQRTAAMSKSIKGLLDEGATNTMHRCVNHRHGFGHDLLPQNAGLSIQHTTITTCQGFSRPPLPSVLLSGGKNISGCIRTS